MKTLVWICISFLTLAFQGCGSTPVKKEGNKEPGMRKYDFSPFEKYSYGGSDLGCVHTPTNSGFKLWAPTADNVILMLYDGPAGPEHTVFPMTKNPDGIWELVIPGNQAGKYYLYRVTHIREDDTVEYTVNDPYAKATSPNCGRTLIYDPRSTDPDGWETDSYKPLSNPVDAVLYEVHLRDFTIHPSSGVPRKFMGKYPGLAFAGGVSEGGQKTALDHLKELGVTHVHILPSYDYGTGDETQSNTPYTWYNWGYDPVLYNNPEGSYATDPNGTVRQKEYKEMVLTLHKNGIGVIFDAVFNHTFQTGAGKLSIFDKVFPGYYYRQEKSGKYGNATGCGNEVASERPMARKFIVDSILHWMREYHVDGFRFDLMGVMDKETLEIAFREAKKLNPEVLFYGEGWDMEKILPKERMMTQTNVRGTGIAAFNDGIRDNLKGDVFNAKARGFVQGAVPAYGGMERLKLQVKGQSTGRNKDSIPVESPNETVNYSSCHDNLCLWDRLQVSSTNSSAAELRSMDKLAAAMVLTSQGIPFLHAGDEFLRSKNKNENSYNNNKPDVNPIDWGLKKSNRDVFEYYRGLIALRKAHPAFRMTDRAAVDAHFDFRPGTETNLLVYALTNHANQDPWNNILVAFNGNSRPAVLAVAGKWNLVVNGEKSGTAVLETKSGEITVPPFSAVVAYTEGEFRWGK